MEVQTQEVMAKKEPGWDNWKWVHLRLKPQIWLLVQPDQASWHLLATGRGGGAAVCARATYSSNLGIGVPEVEKE